MLTLEQLALEVYQIRNQGVGAYWRSRSNLGDLAALLLNCTCMVMIVFREELDTNIYWLRIAASMACVLFWVQMFFWLRLFDSSAQYVDLIVDTVLDISEFAKMLLLLLVMFSSGVTIIQYNRIEAGADPVFPFLEDTGFNLFMEAIFFQYKMLLGDFEEAVMQRSSAGFE